MSEPDEDPPSFRTQTSVSMIALQRDAELLRNTRNEGTMVALLPRGIGAKAELRAHGAFDSRQLFIEHFASIREAASYHAHRRGVLVFAFDGERQAIAHTWLKATRDKTRALIVGRHSRAGLVISSEVTSVALRHLAILVRCRADETPTVRVVDLRTQIGFIDEARRSLRGVVADGPFFLGIGGVSILAMMTGAEPLADDPSLAYDQLPHRDFADADEMTLEHRQRREGTTDVSSLRGPIAADRGELLRKGETPVGLLTLDSGETGVHRAVGAEALARGVLVGRYDRCQLSSEEEDVSRVHLLLIREGEELLAIDTASSNGSTFAGEPFLVHTLTFGHVLRLAHKLEVRWDAHP